MRFRWPLCVLGACVVLAALIAAIDLKIAAPLGPWPVYAGLALIVLVIVVGGGIAIGRQRATIALDAERLETIVALHREVEGAEFDVEGVVLDVLERARTLLGATAATAGVIEGDQIVYRYRTGPGRGAAPIVTPRDGSLSGICAHTGEVVYCEDSERDSRVDKAACRKQGLRSMVIVPLRHRREVVGVLNVNAPEVRAFSRNDIRTVELIGGAISAAYGHAVDMTAKRKLLQELEGTVRALRESEAKLSYQALHDPLTGLPNRTLFLDRLRTALGQRSDPKVAVLFVDLDGFKPVNDTLGHEAGDLLLVEMARRIRRVLRQHDTAARLGGDEFAIICRDAADVPAATRVAERLIEVLQAPMKLGDRDVAVTASIGIAMHDGPAEALLRDADVAMYCAKAEGKAHYRIFEPVMRDQAEARLRALPRHPAGALVAAL
jgi:diguanylate cyclase (GGDEF)-like protein